jgi:hypothetical protein
VIVATLHEQAPAGPSPTMPSVPVSLVPLDPPMACCTQTYFPKESGVGIIEEAAAKTEEVAVAAAVAADGLVARERTALDVRMEAVITDAAARRCRRRRRLGPGWR